MGLTGIVENALRRGGFTSIDVRHNPDVPEVLQIFINSHVFVLGS
jgi:hypothetical protein